VCVCQVDTNKTYLLTYLIYWARYIDRYIDRSNTVFSHSVVVFILACSLASITIKLYFLLLPFAFLLFILHVASNIVVVVVVVLVGEVKMSASRIILTSLPSFCKNYF